MPAYANRVWMSTATTGTGTITLGTAQTGYITFAQGGIANASSVTYTIIDGNNFEVGRGTYTSSGTTLSRDTVLVSLISGTSGTTKLTLSGTATVFITTVAEDTQALSGMFYENDITLTSNYTITTSKNAGTFGPVTINSGVTVTVPSGSTWTIV